LTRLEPYFRLGLIGWPLMYSLSPAIHQEGLRALGLKGEYLLYPVPPLPEGNAALSILFEKIRARQMDGLNVTIPHKQSVLSFLDTLTPLARATGAVNTIFREGDRLVGDNTDVSGFVKDVEILLNRSIDPSVSALILGAGGAARAVVYGLVHAGGSVTIAARRLEQAQQLLSSFSQDDPGMRANYIPLDALSIREWLNSQPPALIVNTTPVGMSPNEDSCPWPEGVRLPGNACLYDLIYHPAETLLMRSAKTAGLKTSNGIGMLVKQAAAALEHWTSKPSPIQAMEAVVLSGGNPEPG
jgi:shikimate dehydrogenase